MEDRTRIVPRDAGGRPADRFVLLHRGDSGDGDTTHKNTEVLEVSSPSPVSPHQFDDDPTGDTPVLELPDGSAVDADWEAA